jgi:hypothetical protein
MEDDPKWTPSKPGPQHNSADCFSEPVFGLQLFSEEGQARSGHILG